jgi:two-component system chemotaxis response regulator CheY
MANVMIVDDSSVMRKIIMKGLRQAGFNIEEALEAGDGLEALGILKQNKLALSVIFCDWNMPNMDGLAFVKEARTAGINTPIIMVTTEGGQDSIDAAKAAGASGYISKPFTPEKLTEEIGKYIS